MSPLSLPYERTQDSSWIPLLTVNSDGTGGLIVTTVCPRCDHPSAQPISAGIAGGSAGPFRKKRAPEWTTGMCYCGELQEHPGEGPSGDSGCGARWHQRNDKIR